MPSNRWGRRLLLTGALLLLITLLALGAAPASVKRQARRLPDGTVVTLEAFTFHQPHRFSSGGRVGQLFAPYLSAGAQQAAGLYAESLPDIDPKTPVAWLSWKKSPGTNSLGYQWMVFDEDGCETQLNGWPGLLGPDAGKRYFPLALHFYPRWGHTWGLRLYAEQVNAPAKPVAEFRLPPLGPERQPPQPALTPRRIAREGELEFELRRFVTGADLYTPSTPPLYGNPTRRTTHLEIAAKRNGQPTADWMPVSFRLSDDMGNALDAGAYANPKQKDNVTRLSFYQNLFREQRHCRLRVEVARTPGAHFRPEELLVIRNVPTPSRSAAPGSSLWFNAPKLLSANGSALACRGIAWSSMGPPYAELKLDLLGKPLAGTRITLLKAVDDAGRTVPLTGAPSIHDFTALDQPLVRYELPLTIRKPMKAVDLTVAVQRTRFVEFQASPTRPTGPVPTSLQAVRSR
jgi:hypothetical protein